MNLFVLSILAASALGAAPPKVRVYVNSDGTVAILAVNPKHCGASESGDSCLARIASKDCPKARTGGCLPSFDMEPSALPARSKRAGWRGNAQSKKLTVDEAAVPKFYRAFRSLPSGRRIGAFTGQDLTGADIAALQALGYTVEEVR